MREIDLPPFEQQLNERVPAGWGGRWYGVLPALVTDIRDPDNQGRVKITLPWSPDPQGARYEGWARLATLMGGNNRGSWFVPDVDDEVLVAFEHGDSRCPYVLGSLWNGRDAAPERMDGAGNNHKKVLRSRNGVRITLDDQDGQERLQLDTPGGQKFTLKDGPGAVTIEDSNGNSVTLDMSGITVTTSVKVTIRASQVAISAGTVTVDAGMTRFSGVVQADTIISNSVISASYTPGAGNIW
jgi:uncharacterized protein involved in type VI secretion and phage assembly